MTITALGMEHALSCPIRAFASVHVNAAALSAWRRNPGSFLGKPLPAVMFKNSEEQTIAGMMALLKAISRAGWEGHDFEKWGVVAGPALFGRSASAQSILRYLKEGSWGVSPHMIPHHSLHALSGAVSVALKMRGPNFTVSGGPNAPAEAFLAAAGILDEDSLPGLWLILTGFAPEFVPQPENPMALEEGYTCHAAALALQPPSDAYTTGPVLSITGAEIAEMAPFDLERFIDVMEKPGVSGGWSLPGAGGIQVEWL